MANTKSAKKQIRKIARKTSINKYWKTNIKKSLRNLDKEIANKNQEGIKEAVNKAKSTLDKASKKNVINKNKASRLKSKLELKAKII